MVMIFWNGELFRMDDLPTNLNIIAFLRVLATILRRRGYIEGVHYEFAWDES